MNDYVLVYRPEGHASPEDYRKFSDLSDAQAAFDAVMADRQCDCCRPALLDHSGQTLAD